MSDSNHPYGATPPVSGPPGPMGGPPSGPPPPPPPPPYAPPPRGAEGNGGKGGGKGLWIGLAVAGVLALAGVIVALVLVLTGDDGDDDGDDRDDASGSALAPDEVVDDLVDAAEDGDCAGVEALLTETAKATDPCSSEEFQLLGADDVDAEVGDPSISGETATVPVIFTSPSGSSDYLFTLEQVDGAWLVAAYAKDHGVSHDSTDPTDGGVSGGPVDPDTDAAPEGTSTADTVANEPRAVVQAFFDAATSGDCATAEDLATAEYLDAEGDCDPDEIPSDIADQFMYDVGEAEVDDAAGTATVPVKVDFSGQADDVDVELVKVGGKWRVNKVG